MSLRSPIAFTVLNDDYGGENPPPWESMYQSNIISAPSNSPFSEYEVPTNDYESLTGGRASSSVPQMPRSYEQGRMNNQHQQERDNSYNLPNMEPVPLPEQINLPVMGNPPYGSAYPSSGYSAFDGEVAMNAGYPAYYALPGVPNSSNPALQDARNSPPVPMTPYSLAMVADQHFKEGFRHAKESLGMGGCTACKQSLFTQTRMYQFAIGFLLILVFILLFMLFKKVSRIPVLRSVKNV